MAESLPAQYSPASTEGPLYAWWWEQGFFRADAASRRLLVDLLRPHRGRLALVIGVVVVENAARLSLPWLVARGIEEKILPRRRTARAGAMDVPEATGVVRLMAVAVLIAVMGIANTISLLRNLAQRGLL